MAIDHKIQHIINEIQGPITIEIDAKTFELNCLMLAHVLETSENSNLKQVATSFLINFLNVFDVAIPDIKDTILCFHPSCDHAKWK